MIPENQDARIQELEQQVADLEARSAPEPEPEPALPMLPKESPDPATTQPNGVVLPPTPTENLDTVLLNYKIDAQANAGPRNNMLNEAYNESETWCPQVIASRTTRQHAYYLILDDVTYLENTYGEYRGRIEWIDNNLNGLWGTIGLAQEECAALGHDI